MASQFIGYNVLVTLKAPPNATVQGEVADVKGQQLQLHNVKPSWTHHVLPFYFIDATDIADLSLGSLAKGQSQNLHAAKQDQNTTPTAPAKQQQFVDPAILSFSKPPSKPASHGSKPENRPLQPSLPNEPTPRQTRPPQVAHTQPAAVLTEPFSNLELNVDGRAGGTPQVEERRESVYGSRDELTPLQAPSQYASKRNRRSGQKKPRQGGYPNAVNEHDGASNTNPKTRGWRQTAFVEPSDPHLTNSPQTHGEKEGVLNGQRRKKKKNRGSYAEDPSGWATEDATDIQELGDFDFQTNLSKFDKRRVFEEIRNDDTTADEARLVSFNRKVPKPGTNGGKNLHWTENVLDSPQESENEESENEPSDAKLSSGTYSARELSRASARGQTSRKGSALLSQPLAPPQLNTIGRGQLSSSRTTSPRPNKTPVSASPIGGPGVSGVSLRLTTTNRSCPTVSPLQTIEVEQIAVTELGLTEDMITENAGRGIAEAAVGLLTNDAAAPTILVLTGNHRTGARAISAARHLRNRGHRVTACMLGIEHENELLESCRKQLDVFKKIGGRVLRWEDLSNRLSTSESGPDLVVDALFGIHIAFDDLRTDDQATAFEMISWTNRSNLDVLSVDVPSGLSASSGEVTIVEGGRLCVNSKSVVCLGAPKTGVVQALVAGEGLSWNLAVADIGVPQIVWRKYGTRRRHGIDFGNRWVVPLRFQASAA
ncbi:YjeF N-terminal domain-like protein [Aspergillus steynii IBT 23096]|uniref:Enhancer of mRNA-decapping protein 3 n=1 Tax=Aspergillus steynii IBT 23096 TaxID=1392250 RepID=A0A2I2FUG7_9EURO|nr:YjeF N-terminal domain-like protein [Aspergillus steynii IBT 23096]PLB44289.1 YjeF N-terminal domain-like protein [Aspergillus steynii IBT 23096]